MNVIFINKLFALCNSKHLYLFTKYYIEKCFHLFVINETLLNETRHPNETRGLSKEGGGIDEGWLGGGVNSFKPDYSAFHPSGVGK